MQKKVRRRKSEVGRKEKSQNPKNQIPNLKMQGASGREKDKVIGWLSECGVEAAKNNKSPFFSPFFKGG